MNLREKVESILGGKDFEILSPKEYGDKLRSVRPLSSNEKLASEYITNIEFGDVVYIYGGCYSHHL